MNGYDEDYVPSRLSRPLKEEEEAELWRRFRHEGDSDARERLIENYLSLVWEAAERMAKTLPPHLDVQDLISYGQIGLLDAIEKFDPAKGVKFSTYCNRRINGAMMDELRRQDWPSRQTRQKANLIKRAREKLEDQLGRLPTESELADFLDLDERELCDLVQKTQIKTMVPLDGQWYGDGGNNLGPIQMLPDSKAVDPLAEAIRKELKEVAMRGLSKDQQQVVTLYYFEHLNLKEIGMVLKLSESRVCQIHQQTLDFLRQKRQLLPFPA